jgi:hypothetical protein
VFNGVPQCVQGCSYEHLFEHEVYFALKPTFLDMAVVLQIFRSFSISEFELQTVNSFQYLENIYSFLEVQIAY